MSDNAPQSEWMTRILGGTDLVTRGVQALLGVAGVLGLVATRWNEYPYLLVVSGLVVGIAGLWVATGYYLRRRRPKPATLLSQPSSTSAYLRGLLPFEEGDRLLGRDVEVGQLLVLLRNLEYRFGFLSGEAGAGKTSLLRARIIPELKKDSWHPVYVPRTGGDPAAAIRKQVLAGMSANFQSPGQELVDLLRRAAANHPDKTLIVIVDQFEEYFVVNRTREAREAFETALGGLAISDLPVRVLFALRKEFVDDLLDLARIVPDLERVRWRLPLRNFIPDTAREVLRTIVQDEALRFSDDLQQQVVADLTQDQRVRPVEFQLVFTTLLTQGVFDLPAYRTLGGAQGVIARFVGETIEPPDLKISEIERVVAQYTLRALCNKEFTTRRPIGLSRGEVAEQITAELKASGHLPASRADIEGALDRVLPRFMEGYILIQEDEERFNLAHDYLAPAVRDATAGVETVEERATRLLDQYLQQARSDRRVVLPWRTLRFVQRYANRETVARTETASLFRRSRLRHGAAAIGASATALILVTILLPFGVTHAVHERLDFSGSIGLSDDLTLLTVLEDESLSIVELSPSEKFILRTLNAPVKQVHASPNGKTLLTIGGDGGLYETVVGTELKSEKVIESLGWKDLRSFQPSPVGFSEDAAWAYASLADGRVFAWPAGNRPKELLRLTSLWGLFSGLVNIDAAQDGMVETSADDRLVPDPPPIGFTREKNLLWVIDGNGSIFLADPGGNSIDWGGAPPHIYFDVSDPPAVVSSADGEWMALGDVSDEVRVLDLSQPDRPTVSTVIRMDGVEGIGRNSTNLWISPDSKWIVARKTFEDFYAARLERPIRTTSFPTIDLARSNSESGLRTVTFDPTGKFVAGIGQDELIYIWDLRNPPGAQAVPTLPRAPLGYRDRGMNVAFCPQRQASGDEGHGEAGSAVLVSGPEGAVHAAPLDVWPLEFRQIGRLAVGDVRFRFAADQQTVFAFDTVGLIAGRCGEPMRRLFESDSEIVDITADGRGNIVLVTNKSLIRIGRTFYFWGLPIWRLEWAALLPPRDLN